MTGLEDADAFADALAIVIISGALAVVIGDLAGWFDDRRK